MAGLVGKKAPHRQEPVIPIILSLVFKRRADGDGDWERDMMEMQRQGWGWRWRRGGGGDGNNTCNNNVTYREGPQQNLNYRNYAAEQSSDICSAQGDTRDPVFFYRPAPVDPVLPHLCTAAGTSITGLAVYTGTQYPPAYRNALFAVDASKGARSLENMGIGMERGRTLRFRQFLN